MTLYSLKNIYLKEFSIFTIILKGQCLLFIKKFRRLALQQEVLHRLFVNQKNANSSHLPDPDCPGAGTTHPHCIPSWSANTSEIREKVMKVAD